jgi:hypothetical protein
MFIEAHSERSSYRNWQEPSCPTAPEGRHERRTHASVDGRGDNSLSSATSQEQKAQLPRGQTESPSCPFEDRFWPETPGEIRPAPCPVGPFPNQLTSFEIECFGIHFAPQGPADFAPEMPPQHFTDWQASVLQNRIRVPTEPVLRHIEREMVEFSDSFETFE